MLFAPSPFEMTAVIAREACQKRLFYRSALILCCLITLVFSLPVSAGSQQQVLHPHGLLWKLSKPGQPDSYLFGTIHLSDPRLAPLMRQVRQKIASSSLFAMEIVLDKNSQRDLSSYSYLDGGRLLEDYVDEITLDAINRIMEQYYGIPVAVVNRMKPWAVMATLSSPPPSNNQVVLDIELQELAEEAGRKVIGLETVAEQIAVLGGMPLNEQLWLLKKTVEEFDQNMSMWEQLLDLYLARDLQGLYQSQQQQMDPHSDIDDRFMVALVDQRNRKMADRMMEQMQYGSVFTAVGALHLPGDKGILHLLELNGYSVTAVDSQ